LITPFEQKQPSSSSSSSTTAISTTEVLPPTLPLPIVQSQPPTQLLPHNKPIHNNIPNSSFIQNQHHSLISDSVMTSEPVDNQRALPEFDAFVYSPSFLNTTTTTSKSNVNRPAVPSFQNKKKNSKWCLISKYKLRFRYPNST